VYSGHMGHIRMCVVKEHYGIPHEHARTLRLGGSIKVFEGSRVALCVDVDFRVFETAVLNDCRFVLDEDAKSTVQWFQQ
jgi:hypothetical protein